MTAAPSPAVEVRRLPDRAHYDPTTVAAVLDAAPICHVGIVDGDAPFVIPTIHARIDDAVYLHGSPASRLLRTSTRTPRICVTASIIDGLVLARSAFHHSMNYRSVVVVGEAETVTDPDEKMRAFEALVEHVAPGRWSGCRPPSEQELRATLVVRLALDEASVKIRTGDPVDDEADHDLDVWAGVVPVTTTRGSPRPAADLRPGIEVPDHVAALAQSPAIFE